MPDSPIKVEDIEKAINESGFPLQLGLKRLLQTAGTRWRVALWEHPWRDPLSGDEKLLDMALSAESGQMMMIECKRARDTEWIFLREQSGGQHDSRLATQCWVTAKKGNHPPDVFDWTNVPHVPGSPVALFCVIRKNNQRSQELLERTAAELVRATEAVARQELKLFETTKKRLSRIYTPVIVTTAKLILCDIDYQDFDVQSGEMLADSSRQVPFIRFTKSLSVPETYLGADNLSDISKQSERSVVVVSAGSFVEFLNKWDVGNIGSLAAVLWDQ